MSLGKNHVVIGAGEVGNAIAQVLEPYYKVHLRDVEATGPVNAEVLHICFPYSNNFNEHVERYKQAYKPRLIIVHSTVPVGTCDPLDVVHSPVRGRHPNLAESVKIFTKFFGGKRAHEAANLFESIGIKCKVTSCAQDTEAGKLWELAQYGLAILIEKEIHVYCERNDLNFDIVYTQFAETYNAGYQHIGESQFTRPVISHMPGPIGGHCVVQNSLLLEHPLADLVAQAGIDEQVLSSI